MNTMNAFTMGEMNRGKEEMVFDWIRAAELIKELNPQIAEAGLRDDWEWTGGTIYRNGKIVKDESTYLSSTWAVPEISLDGKTYECYTMDTKWDSDTKWPEEAINILHPKLLI